MKSGIEKEYPLFFAAQSKDKENVEQSSSGGVFYELCQAVIIQKWVIYGAVSVSPLRVEHARATDLTQAAAFRRSKYMQSRNTGCFRKIRADLESGRSVLFSGVGCQIAGLLQYLGIRYENLFTCEVVCHGMPINEAMEKYIEEKETLYGDKLASLNFRDKSHGWRHNCIAEYYESGRCDLSLSSEHPVHSLYLKGINMKSGCASCKYARLPRIADITLADFWQYEGKINHCDRGMSLISVNTEKGEKIFEQIKKNVNWEETTKELALKSCRHMSKTPLGHRSRDAFQSLIREKSFSTAYNLCNFFGEVVMPVQLQTIEYVELSISRVIAIFEEDTQEIIYVLDEQKCVQGIITFGAFISNCINQDNWVNQNFYNVNLRDNPIRNIKKIFSENEKIKRIPILDENRRLLYEVRRYVGANGKNDSKKVLIPFARLKYNHNRCFFVKRPDLLSDMGKYKEREVKRIQNQLSFPVMQADWNTYKEEFEDIYGRKADKDYIDALCEIPQIILRGKRYIHADGCSQYVNVVGGARMTVGQPEDYEFIIHMYGRCGVFGYAVEDQDTMPSALQAILNKRGRKIRVENHGLWGADDGKILENISLDLEEGIIRQEDIVIVYMACLPWIEELEKLGVRYYDTTIEFHRFLGKGATFFDKPGHMTAEGYEFIAQYLYQKLEKTDSFGHYNANIQRTEEQKRLIENRIDTGTINVELMNYLEETKKLFSAKELETSIVGAIVMNCNPFTIGHRYLIEKALEQVDILILFVLEEDKSYFTFEDRFEMVKLGTKDLKRTYVVPGGEFIISALTFPEYFLKEYQPDVTIQAADDVVLFGKYIAPAFHIQKRFVGTEPADKVTAQYNEQLKKILPLYGVELCEIQRLKEGSGYVTATKVRKYVETYDYSKMKNLVPYTTLRYLKEKWKRRE